MARQLFCGSGEPPTVIHAGRYTTTELWVSGAPRLLSPPPMLGREWALEPPPGGACFRIVEIAPDARRRDDGNGGESRWNRREFQGTHATDTLDYVTILRGEVTLIVGGMARSERLVRARLVPARLVPARLVPARARATRRCSSSRATRSCSSPAFRTTGRIAPARAPS